MGEQRIVLFLPKSEIEKMLPPGSRVVGVQYDLGAEQLEVYVTGLGPSWQEMQQPWAVHGKIVREDGEELYRG